MPNEDSIKFACSHCAQTIEAPAEMRGTEVKCPGCGKKVIVWRMPSTFTERENLDAAAKGLVVVAGILMAVAVVAIVWSVAGEGPAFTPLCVAGAAVGLALWMFLFAQLIYIRAALEK